MGSVSFDGTRVNGAGDGNSTTGFTSWGATVTAEPDYFYTNSYCISVLVKTSEVGFYCTGTSVNFTSPVRVWLAKVIQTNYTAIDGLGLQLFLGNDTSNHYRYEIFSATTYPAAGGFQIVPIDPNVAAYRTQTVGSPNLTTLTFYGLKSDANAQAKAPNLGMDAVDYITSGTGLTLTGTSSTFSDFVTFDENTTTNRYGIVTTREGIIYVVGVLTIGTPISSVAFSDSNRTIVFPSGRFNTGFCGIDLSLGNASTTVSMNTITMIGRGTAGTNDTRPDFGVSGTSGSATIDACTFTNFRDITLTSAVTVTDSTFNSCGSMTQSSASISGCVFDSPATATGVGFLSSNNPSNLSSNSFVSSGTGHAITITSAGTYTFSANTFSGYSGTPGSNLTPSSGSNDAAIYNNSSGSVTLNITNAGSNPSVRNGASATTTVNSNVSVTITVKDQSGSAIPGAEVAIFQDDTSRTVIQSSTATNTSGVVSASAASGTGAIIIRVRQSDEITTATFNTGTGISSNIITTASTHGFSTGQAVTYSRNGGSIDIGPEPGTYYVRAASTSTVTLHATAAHAVANTNILTLTASGSETHTLEIVRYVPNSATGTIGSTDFSTTITMVTDNIAD